MGLNYAAKGRVVARSTVDWEGGLVYVASILALFSLSPPVTSTFIWPNRVLLGYLRSRIFLFLR